MPSTSMTPLGRRIEKNVNGQVTTYVYDGLNMVADYNGLWTVRSKYVFGLGIDEPLSIDQGEKFLLLPR